MTRVTRLATAAALAAAPAATASAVFTESDFDPASWTAATPFFSSAPDSGESMTVTSDRFISGGPEGGFMLTQFVVDVPVGFNAAWAPVMMNGFVYDPAVDGPIQTIAASMRTLPVASGMPDHLGTARVFLEQDGRYFITSHPAPNNNNFFGFDFEDDALTRSFTGALASDFIEIVPSVGFDHNAHPDFAGSPIRFGFGLTLTSTLIGGNPPTTIVGAFDDVAIRIASVPAPGAATLAVGALAAATRRKR